MRSVSLLAAILAFLGPPSQEERSGKELKIALAAATFKKGQYRPGWDFKSDPPLQGWKATVGSEPFVFVDMDGD
ncbi:MAG TPA: hypothetical protein VJU16_08940, partial [Planctomycetota bacterium]|nr:hypothetical protein [Planctomycetota bacterium]